MGSTEVVKIGRKGIVVIPKSIREKLGLSEGDVLKIEIAGDSIILRKSQPKRVRLGGRISRILSQIREEELELEG